MEALENERIMCRLVLHAAKPDEIRNIGADRDIAASTCNSFTQVYVFMGTLQSVLLDGPDA
jgi:hypothetical protein